jgi:hypothetical protein
MAGWQIAAFLGGTTGIALGMLAFFVVPEICEPVVQPFLMVELGSYNCFGVGEASRAEWALYIGGAAAVIVAGIKYLTKKPA